MPWQENLKTLLLPAPAIDVGTAGDGLSSVLVAIGPHQESKRDEILLIKRTMHVETHKGQVSFPGGFWEPEDGTILDTALREADEEIGAKAGDLEVLGALSPVRTRGDVIIYPWVAKFSFPYPFVLSVAEVDRLLFLSVERLCDEGLNPVTVPVGDLKVQSVGITVEGELVWGATARILEELRELLLATESLSR